MGTRQPAQALTAHLVRSIVETHTQGGTGTSVGIELELFPMDLGPPTRRIPLDGQGGVRATVAHRAELDEHARGRLPGGSLVTVEPGAQVEIATSCAPDVDTALAEADAAAAILADAFDVRGAVLAAVGADLWHDLTDVPQQLTAPRYPAMAAYFDRRGPDGAQMMRHTCALQVTLDLGPTPAERHDRWTVANLLAPVLTATFATSPTRDGRVRSQRSLAWQRLDPTRTGFPARLLDDNASLTDQILDAALDADVLLARVPPAGGGQPGAERVRAGRPGWRFGDWLRDGDDVFGWPTADDLTDHLTTLFHEVRARGPVELRGIDALPRAWRSVPVVLTAGALFEPQARRRIRDVLARHRPDLPALLDRSARAGVSDPALCAMAVEVWSFALAGARRLPGIGATHLHIAEAFLDHYTLRGRCPADELAERLRADPADALRWVAEPVPTAVRSSR